MRKITLFFMTLFGVLVGTVYAQVQPVTGKFYRIKDNTRTKYLTIESYNANSTGTKGTVPVLDEEFISADQMWELVDVNADNSQYKLRSKSGYYLQCRGWNCDAVSSGGSTIILEAVSGADQNYYLRDSDKSGKFFKVQVVDGVAHPFCDAPEGNADIVTWSFVEVSDEELRKAGVLNAAQNIVNGASDVRVGAYTTSAVAGLSSALAAFNDNKTEENFAGVESAYNELLANPDAVITLSAGDKFRILSAASDGRGYVVYSTLAINENTSENTPTLAGVTSNFRDNFPQSIDLEGVYSEWAFIENDGNRYLYNVGKEAFINPVSGSTFEFTTATPAIYQKEEKGNSKWAVKFGNQYMELSPGFGLTGAVRQIGNANDQGSWFYLEKMTGTVDADLQNKMNVYIEDAKVSGWKNVQLSVLGYVGGYDKSLENDINAVSTKEEVDAFVAGHQTIALQDGGYYFVKTAKNQNAGQGAYLSYAGTDCRVYLLGEGEKPGIQHVWQFNAPEDGDFKLMSCNQGKYLTTGDAPAASAITSDFENGYKYTFTINSWAEVTIKDGNDKVLRTEGSSQNYKVNQWTNGTNMNTDATWYIVPAEEIYLTLNAGGDGQSYATAYLPFAVSGVSGAKAYTAEAPANGQMQLNEAANGVAANTGIVLISADAADKATLTIGEGTAPAAASALQGTTVAKTVDANSVLTLGKSDESVGFFAYTGTELRANSAYLEADNGAAALVFSFGNTDAIESVEAATVSGGKVYDLSGRRVSKAGKGIYIVNGKKVIK